LTPTLNAYNVTALYYEPRYVTITVPAASIEEAQKKALEFLKDMKEPKVIDTYDISTVPAIKDLITAQASQIDDAELREALGIVEAVHDEKELN